MATYDSLSVEDKAVVDNLSGVLRAAAGEIGRLMNHLGAIQDDVNGIAIFGTIDAGETIPNKTGLTGADSMTKAELAAMWATLQTILDTYNTTANRNVWTKACGIANMIG